MCELCGWEALIERIDTALSDAKAVPSKGAEFADSVCERLSGIRETVEDSEHCSDKQRIAVTNMHNGLRRWLPKEERELDFHTGEEL